MERTIERLIFDKEMLQQEVEDLVKEISELNIKIANKTHCIRTSKTKLKELTKAYKTLKNLSNKIVGLAVTLKPIMGRIDELTNLIETESVNVKILEELRQKKSTLKKDMRYEFLVFS
ncbi:MAG: hypothetical protein PWQ37_2884 [Candidatus Petromonas sp.]|nr:hypothetical protein [Candidatus Petromonas sp.]